MSNIQENAKKRKEFQAGLEANYGVIGDVPITSIEHFDMIEHKPGIVCMAKPYWAARMIYRHTHRLATPEEIEQYKEDLAKRTADCEAVEHERRAREGKSVVVQTAPHSNEGALMSMIAQLQSELSQVRQAQSAQASVGSKSSAPTPPASRTNKDAQ